MEDYLNKTTTKTTKSSSSLSTSITKTTTQNHFWPKFWGPFLGPTFFGWKLCWTKNYPEQKLFKIMFGPRVLVWQISYNNKNKTIFMRFGTINRNLVFFAFSPFQESTLTLPIGLQSSYIHFWNQLNKRIGITNRNTLWISSSYKYSVHNNLPDKGFQSLHWYLNTHILDSNHSDSQPISTIN